MRSTYGVTGVAIADVGLWRSCALQPRIGATPDDRDRAMEPPRVRGPWRGMTLIDSGQKHDEGDFARCAERRASHADGA